MLDLSAFADTTQTEIHAQFPVFARGDWTLADLDRLVAYLVEKGEYDSLDVSVEADGRYRVDIGRLRRVGLVRVNGTSALPETAVRNEFGVFEKSRFDYGALRAGAEKVRKAYEAQGFQQASVNVENSEGAANEVELNLVVREGPRVLLSTFNVSAANARFREKVRRWLADWKNEPLTAKTLADLRRELRAYLSKNKFYAATVNDPAVTVNEAGTQARLDFHFDRTDEYEVTVEGARATLRAEVQKVLDLDNYASANPQLATELATRVRAYYLREGYARVDVAAEERPGADAFARVIAIRISEGPRIAIREIQIRGAYSQPEEFYRQFLLDHSSAVVAERFYVKEDVDAALQNLINDRLNNGFLKARIVSSRSIFNKERNGVSLVIQLDEGPLTVIDSVAFEGNQNFSGEELARVTGLQGGSPLRLYQLEDSIKKLRQYYLGQGYLEYTLLNEKEDLVTYSQDNSRVSVRFKFAEGPRVYVASILIDGNTLTKDYVVLKELEFKVGDVLTPALMEESIQRLQRLGHFSQAEIRTLEERTNISRRTVVVRVTDKDPGLLNIGAGVTSESGITLRGYLGLGYRNIGGTGRGISGRVDANYNVTELKFLESKLSVGYLEPYLFDSRTRGRGNITRSRYVSDVRQRKASESTQFVASFEQDITSHWLVVWDAYSIAEIRDFLFDKDGEDDGNATRAAGLSSVKIGSTALTTDFDFRDHPFNPTSGVFLRFNAEYGAPVLGSTETIKYLRSQAFLTHYLSVAPKWRWVWANAFRAGDLQNLLPAEKGAVPYDKKGLLLGGTSTVRGFTPSEAFLSSSDFTRDESTLPSTWYNLRSRAWMFMLKSELRFPISGNFGGALFGDYGSVKTRDDILISEQNRVSAGLALRYVTPFVVVSAEYAWKLGVDSRRREGPGALHLSIGTF